MSEKFLLNYISFTALFIILLFSVSGCATGRSNNENSTRTTEIEAVNRRVDELYHRLSVLQFMVDSHDRALSDREEKIKKSGYVSPLETPDNSSAVTEENIAITEKTVEKQAEKAGEQSQNPILLDEGAVSTEKKTVRKETYSSPESGNMKGKSTEVIYAEGLNALKAGDYPTAAAKFRAVVEEDPNHDLADNAVYWTGEIFYDQKDYHEAIRIFKRLVETYPNEGKVPDALLKIGYSYQSLGDNENAVKYLKKVVMDYPFTNPGSKAEAMLNRIEKSR